MIQRRRPLSPWFSAYAWRYTFFNPSVIHRATGVALAVGFIALCYFLVSLARGPQSYSRALVIFANPIFKVFIVGWLWSFFFHFSNGIRHLFWDAGYGFEKRFARTTARIVIAAATIVTMVSCFLLFRHNSF